MNIIEKQEQGEWSEIDWGGGQAHAWINGFGGIVKARKSPWKIYKGVKKI